MTMSRKDYRAVAEAIRGTRDQVGINVRSVDTVAHEIADALQDASGYDVNGNRRFDRYRFLEACGVPG